MAKMAVPQTAKELPLAVVRQMTVLATSGFGLVAALAWNNVIQELVDTYIKPHSPQGSSVISLLLYAVFITAIAVAVTLQLTRAAEMIDNFGGKKKETAKSKK